MAMRGIKMTASAEEPAVAGSSSSLPVREDETDHERAVLGDDDTDSFDVLGLPAPSYGSALGDDDEDDEAYDDYMMSDSDSDSESEFEDHHGNRVRFWDGDAAAAGSESDLVSGPLTFLGRLTPFASFQGAAGFMRLSREQELPGGGGGEDDDREARGAIVVHYRLTRFSRPRQSDDDAHGVEVRDFATTLHHVRYLVPFPVAADPASTLRLVGAALAADVYPYRHYVQLQAVWSGLVAAAVPAVRVPARATRLVVTVDVGVLRRSEDRTPERMARVRAALAAVAGENDDAPPMSCGLEQHLPAPVVCCDEASSSSGGEVARPAKRRRFNVEGEMCAICYETMEHGLAAWPRCSHVFHGKCLEKLLVMVQHRCPMCRSTLSVKGSMFDLFEE